MGYTSYHRSSLNFDHDDVPERYKYFIHIMEKLEHGNTVVLSPSIPFADVLWLADYYEKQGLTLERDRATGNVRSIRCKLRGIPDDMDVNWSKRTVKTAFQYVGAVLLGLFFCFMFFMALLL